ncbi:MAG: hypothetical protein ACRCUY_05400 [Thermoguttaceae bacterium]
MSDQARAGNKQAPSYNKFTNLMKLKKNRSRKGGGDCLQLAAVLTVCTTSFRLL